MDIKPLILVLEDEKPLVRAISEKLESDGCEVRAVDNVDAALAVLKGDQSISAIWLDHYLMGEKDGLDLLAEVKRNEAWNSIPVFVVSNTAGPDKKQAYLKLEVEKYYVKSEHKLSEIVEDVIQTIKA